MHAEFITIRSSDIRNTVEQIKANRSTAIRINNADGYRRKDLEILRELPWVTHLEIVMDDETDWSPVASLGELTSLSVSGSTELDLSLFPKLTVFSGEWREAQNISSCRRLRHLAIAKLRADGMQFFEKCEALEDLVLAQSTIRSFRGLNNPRLVDLTVSHAKVPISFKGIGGAPRLVVLEVSRCPGVEHLDELKALRHLFDLKLNSVHSVPSLAPILKIPHLRGLRLVGTTVSDGNLDGLKDLRWVAFDNKKQYSMTEEQLDTLLRSKGGGAVVRPGDHDRYMADIEERKASALAA